MPALKGQFQEAASAAFGRKGSIGDRAARARDLTTQSCSAERLWFDRRGQWHRHSARQAGSGVDGIRGVFARLDHPVDFEALDDQPVDLVFLLLAPEGAGADHLKALSRHRACAARR